ncbi:hypothetical protein [Synechococcus sp. BIOS-U3-1]|uniref:hypothetical protein n=1 Tax=Synechococcus sp. BIOS-U3-1 TaxID=1400865 RepID=UPI001648AD69|nr:hypothetical protein [Synechococcus sp. BIOS-U3-1]
MRASVIETNAPHELNDGLTTTGDEIRLSFIETKVLQSLASGVHRIGDFLYSFNSCLSIIGEKWLECVACVNEGLRFLSGFQNLSGRSE